MIPLDVVTSGFYMISNGLIQLRWPKSKSLYETIFKIETKYINWLGVPINQFIMHGNRLQSVSEVGGHA